MTTLQFDVTLSTVHFIVHYTLSEDPETIERLTDGDEFVANVEREGEKRRAGLANLLCSIFAVLHRQMPVLTTPTNSNQPSSRERDKPSAFRDLMTRDQSFEQSNAYRRSFYQEVIKLATEYYARDVSEEAHENGKQYKRLYDTGKKLSGRFYEPPPKIRLHSSVPFHRRKPPLFPITEVGFDHLAYDAMENTFTLERLVQTDWIAHLGRPAYIYFTSCFGELLTSLLEQ
ncbi:hypothetical protein F5888DRAFT_1712863, partial [Russula emetica]